MILYFDTETTALRPGEICEISYVMQDKEKVTGKNFFFSVNSMDFGAQMVHGFSVEKLNMLSHGKRFCDFIDEIAGDFNSADVIVSHNISFDLMFLRAEFERQGKDLRYSNCFCTMKYFTPICKLLRSCGTSYKYPKLNELCSHLGITVNDIAIATDSLFGAETGYHDARFDATAVYLIINRALALGIDLGEINNKL